MPININLEVICVLGTETMSVIIAIACPPLKRPMPLKFYHNRTFLKSIRIQNNYSMTEILTASKPTDKNYLNLNSNIFEVFLKTLVSKKQYSQGLQLLQCRNVIGFYVGTELGNGPDIIQPRKSKPWPNLYNLDYKFYPIKVTKPFIEDYVSKITYVIFQADLCVKKYEVHFLCENKGSGYIWTFKGI